MELLLSTPYWFLLLCLAAGLAYSYLLYSKTTTFIETSPWLVRALSIFRFINVSLLCLFLLSPFIKTSFREVEKPTVVIAVDNSQSIASDSSHASSTAILDAVKKLSTKLSLSFDVKTVSFGSTVNTNPSITFTEKQTNISDVFDYIKTLYTGRNLGSVILVSDGIYNAGSNPVYKANELKVPIYSIALGDTTVNTDVVLSSVRYNKTAYIGNNFPLEINIVAHQAAGENTTLNVQEEGSVLFSRPVTISGNAYHLTVPVFLEAKSKGIHRYTISLSTVAGEKNISNNKADIYVEVLDGKQKILLLAQSPHPDLAMLKTVLEKSNTFEVKIAYQQNFAESLSGYNLVVLHQLPGISNSFSDKIKNEKMPVFYIIGTQTNLGAFNALETGVVINQPIAKINEVFATPNENFTLFTVSDNVFKTIRSFPPLYAPFGSFTAKGELYTLLKQRIGSVETNQPLLYFSTTNGVRTGVLTAEGCWKWRLREYAEKNNTDATDELFTKIAQYLIVKDKRTPFRIQYKRALTENEPAIFDAELYNDAGELINDPEITLSVISAEQKEYRYTFSRFNKTYQLNAGNLPSGKYSFKADTKLGDKLFTERGEFSVSSVLVENTETTANHQLLFSMAKNSGGQLVSLKDADRLTDIVLANESIKPISYYHKKLLELISLKGIFALLVLFLTVEWFLRKRSGGY